jgi:hypothetical protein
MICQIFGDRRSVRSISPIPRFGQFLRGSLKSASHGEQFVTGQLVGVVELRSWPNRVIGEERLGPLGESHVTSWKKPTSTVASVKEWEESHERHGDLNYGEANQRRLKHKEPYV